MALPPGQCLAGQPAARIAMNPLWLYTQFNGSKRARIMTVNRHGIETIDTQTLEPWLQGRSFADWKRQLDAQGYLIFNQVMSAQEIQRVREALAPHLTHRGRNNFEGFHSNRVYSLLSKAPQVFSELVTHPLALAFAEAELGASCLLSALLAIDLHPGETVQPWHRDDDSIAIELPRPAFGISTFWAIDETTATNGATEFIPGSHLDSGDRETSDLFKDAFDTTAVVTDTKHDPQPQSGSVRAIMPAGSLMIAKSTLLHRGGANRSDGHRLLVTPQYCAGWARQLENMMAAVPRDIAANLPQRTRELIGYNIHGAFMGYVDGVHPDKLLDLEHQNREPT
jgi:ectoine hydroxylase-related dioxygenase (phytanoyl-CoA dioxygenase family)